MTSLRNEKIAVEFEVIEERRLKKEALSQMANQKKEWEDYLQKDPPF
jgi:hypothetical protein